MKKSKQEAAETRQRIVKTAAMRNGINGTGLSDLMAAAGLTHGGFYRHFDSKDQLVAECCAAAIDSVAESLISALSRKAKRSGVEALATSYLSKAHRDNSSGCYVTPFDTNVDKNPCGLQANYPTIGAISNFCLCLRKLNGERMHEPQETNR